MSGIQPGAIPIALTTSLQSAAAIPGRAVHPKFRSLFPQGLAPGGYALDAPLSIGLGLLAGGDWAAIVGLGDLGAEAITEWGIDPLRLAVVPEVGDDWFGVVAELAEVAETILALPPRRPSDAATGRLLARLRHRRTVLLVLGEWARPQATISARTKGWSGIGDGHGYLMQQHLLVEVTQRHHTRRQWIVRGSAPLGESTETSLTQAPVRSPMTDSVPGGESRADQSWAS